MTFLLNSDESSRLIPYLILALTLLATLLLADRLRLHLTYLAHHRRTSCHPAPGYPQSRLLLGYDIYRRRMHGLATGTSSALYAADFHLLGRKTFQESLFGRPVISTMDARNIAHIHSAGAGGFDLFGKNAARARFAAPVIGVGIFLAEGEHWRRSRGLVRPMFARAELADLGVVERHLGRFLEGLPRDGSGFDVQGMLKRLFLDITTESLLGESIDSQLPEGRKAADEFMNAWDETLLGLQKRRQPGTLLFYSLFDRKWPKAYRCLHAYFDRYVQKALQRKKKKKDSATEHPQKEASDKDKDRQAPNPPSQRYFLLDEMARHIADPLALRFELINIFLASRDTTAILASNVFFQLARHPGWFDKLRQEALGHPNLSSSTITSHLTLETLRALPTFRHVINETLRTLGPSGRIQRLALADTTLPTGGGPDGSSPIYVPRGAAVVSLIRNLHRDRDLWGEDADEFRPERWEGRNKEGGGPGWEFAPFLGGPRACPAREQVVVQVTCLLAGVVLAFRGVRCEDPVREYVERQGMVVESRNGVKISLVV